MVEIKFDDNTTESSGGMDPILKMVLIGGVIIIALVLFFVFAIGAGHPKATIVNGTTVSDNVECKLTNRGPDNNCTPGTILPVPKDGICSPTYTQPAISNGDRNEVFKRYGITDASGWEVLYWIPVELGGSTEQTNMFPMTAEPKPGYVERLKAAKKLKDLVCGNKIPLASAQYMITHDWQSNSGLYS